MNNPDPGINEEQIQKIAVDTTIRLGILLALLFWCFQIIAPFLYPIVWGIIIAVAAYGSYQKLTAMVGNRPTLAAFLVTLILILVMLVPVALLTESMVSGINVLADEAKQGTMSIPPPPDRVAEWPVIGESLHRIWLTASTNIEAVLKQFTPQLKSMGGWLLSAAAETGFGLLQFLIAFLIAGLLLANAAHSKDSMLALARRLAGGKGEEFVDIAAKTVNGVTRGVLGVAVIQAILAGLGFLVVDIPGAGLWAFLAMVFAIIQLGILPITIPAVIYVFSTAEPLTAILFLIWNLIISTVDNVIKPLLMGKGAPVPIAIIFLGSLGGFMASGILGLFTGAIILSIGYTLYFAWIAQESGLDKADDGKPEEGKSSA
jgi:predicted PurR-regulated permease PerM